MVKNTQEQGTRKATASDVAERAGVSKWTVSRAFTEGASISPKALARVRQAAEELGYKPNLLARSLTTRRTNIVGLVVDELGNPNLAMILDEITRQLQRKGYMAMLLNITSEQSYRAAMSLADQFQVDGLIFLGTILSDELLQLARNIGNIPLIVLYRNSDNPDIHVVSTDGYRAGQEIAALMVAEGHRRIGYMAGPPSESTQLRRLDGFRDGLAERGKELALMLGAEHYQREQGYRSLLHYLDTTPREARVEALFCENDILAIGAMEALKVRGEEGSMAIVGFDDIDQAASPCYQLTTYRQPLQVLIGEAIRRLTADEAPSRYLAPGALVLRTSHLRGDQ
ncbi:LacI family transcriptional regulator [Zobellella endophytica]|uniref:LacI family transcriptional regulator n=1 Tax=Zobellella endophytica TaxID=2116700 RepID=A0A2P7RAM5_9GAMM|nr:LacI family DNA-binding transcriptional regulator [Zobellella endophytica]PSJ47294.1 LacI family transcriptional regulator [Zobellella endophytica]